MSAVEWGLAASIFFTSSTEIKPAEQPCAVGEGGREGERLRGREGGTEEGREGE